MFRHFALVALALRAGFSTANPVSKRGGPTVTLDQGTFTGSSVLGINSYLGIPFAQPPTGNLRFELPQPIPPYVGEYDATSFGLACPQQSIELPILTGLAQETVDYITNTIYGDIFPDSEDCLTVNVWAPSWATPSSKLPVAVWIFGGGFELGSPSTYDGATIVSRSIALGEPVVYVSLNYRISAWGFLASQEVQAAGVGNLGLQDQREAFRWVQKYITQFGGDSSRVTIWGESAGAISVGLHMVTNGGNTEGLFHGAFMESGSPIPVGPITDGQQYYDAIVEATGCSSSSDTLACLRTVPQATLKAAVNQSPGVFAYQSLVLAWIPRVDGVFLTDDPQNLVLQGSVADIPFVTGDCDDEGTLFSLSTTNITNSADLQTYISTYWLPKATQDQVTQLMSLYPDDITQGSPFDTGLLNAITPEFKRIASFIGDATFQAPRRFFLSQVSGKQNTWSYLNQRLKSLPVLGSAHATDLLNVYAGGDLADAVINFVNNLNPNGFTLINWPQYTTQAPTMFTLLDGVIPQTLTEDNYREDAINYLTELTLSFPL